MAAFNKSVLVGNLTNSSVLVEGRIRQVKLDNESYWTEVVADTVQFLGKTKTVTETNTIATEEIEDDLAF